MLAPVGGGGGLPLTAALRLESGLPFLSLAMVPAGMVRVRFPSCDAAIIVSWRRPSLLIMKRPGRQAKQGVLFVPSAILPSLMSLGRPALR